MSSGLLALLDDIAALVKVTAASLDDIPAQVAKTSAKVSGVVIDDAAVTPKYVVGLSPKRELAIIYNIARRSLLNKLLYLGPAALLLGYAAPWLIQPILMVGGAYLCFEGYEKVHSMLHPDHLENTDDEADSITPEELEKIRTNSAVQTDFILSGEIIAIAYATVAERDLVHQVGVLAAVAIGITVAVYGFVGLLVKTDDIGLFLASKGKPAFVRAFGRALVRGMPHFLHVLGIVGTAAMLWVGAEIIAHGFPTLYHILESTVGELTGLPALRWLYKALCCAVLGLLIGWAIAATLHAAQKLRPKK